MPLHVSTERDTYALVRYASEEDPQIDVNFSASRHDEMFLRAVNNVIQYEYDVQNDDCLRVKCVYVSMSVYVVVC